LTLKPKRNTNFSNPVQEALGSPKILIFPSKHNHLEIIVMRGKRTELIADYELYQDVTCKKGCSHWNHQYCECECHDS